MNRWTNASEEDKENFRKAVSKWKKKMRENYSEEEREKHIKQLKENHKKWRINQTEEKKKAFSKKMSDIMKERRKDKKYRELKHNQVSEQMKKQREWYSDEEKKNRIEDIKLKARQYRDSLNEEEKKEYIDKMYQWRVKAAEKREKEWKIKWPCQFPKCLSWAKAISNTNLQREKEFLNNWFNPIKEYPLWDYCYDFKIWNTLIEINPYAYHNSTWVPRLPWIKLKDKTYHYNKAQNAISKWYNIIEVWDWLSVDEIISLLKNNKTISISSPKLHWYNPKTKEHIIDDWRDIEQMINEWFLEIRDCWETYL